MWEYGNTDMRKCEKLQDWLGVILIDEKQRKGKGYAGGLP
jgi:hypothetical protein